MPKAKAKAEAIAVEVEVAEAPLPTFPLHCILCGAYLRINADGKLVCARNAEHVFGGTVELVGDAEEHEPASWRLSVAWPA